MTLIRYNPVRNLFDLRTSVDRLFDDFFGLERGTMREPSLAVVPAVDLEETDDAFKITAELPGMDKKDIHITFENNVLTISGEKKAEKEIKEENYHRLERSYGKFQRSFELPGYINRDKIEADYKDGVLHITVPKSEEAKPKQIEVKVK